MANESNGGMGGCLMTILIALVFLAAFGFVDWSTVGSFARFIIYFLIAGLILMVLLMIWASSRKD